MHCTSLIFIDLISRRSSSFSGLSKIAKRGRTRSSITLSDKNWGGIVEVTKNYLYQDISANFELLKKIKRMSSTDGTDPSTVSHHCCCLVVCEQFHGRVLHMLQGLGSGQPSAFFNPSRRILQSGQELDRKAWLLVWEIKVRIRCKLYWCYE